MANLVQRVRSKIPLGPLRDKERRNTPTGDDHPAGIPLTYLSEFFGRHFRAFLISAILGGLVIAYLIILFRYFNNSAIPLEPLDGTEFIGSESNHLLTLRFDLPKGKLDELAEINIESAQKSRTYISASESFAVPNSFSGTIQWRVRPIWKDGFEIKHGFWSEFRKVHYYKDRLEKILINRRCIVGVGDLSESGRMVNVDSNLRVSGYEIELLKAFFAAELESRGQTGPVQIDYRRPSEGWGDQLFSMLSAKNHSDVDLLASGMTPTEDREAKWDLRFSRWTIQFHSVLVVRNGIQPLGPEGRLLLRTIGAADKTTNKEFLLSVFGPNDSHVYVERETPYYDHLIDKLIHRTIDGFIVDSVYLSELRSTHPEITDCTQTVFLRPVANPKFQLSTAAYGLRPGDAELLGALNKFLRTGEADDQRKSLQLRYFPELPFYSSSPDKSKTESE